MKTADEVFADLLPFLLEIYRILDRCTGISLQDFERRSRPFEGHHFASGVRHEAKCQLGEVSDTFPCNLSDLPNNGLLAVYNNYAIRIRKADDGGLPPTNGSQNLMDFYEQVPYQLLLFKDGVLEFRVSDVNLVVIWDTDSEHRLAWVEVLYPIGEDSVAWRRQVPHPATVTLGSTDPEPTVPDFDFDDTEEEIDSDENVN